MRFAYPLLLVLGGCKAMSTASADAGPAVAADIEFATRLPSPANENANFAINDEVSVIKDDGTFETEASVQAVGGKLVFLTPGTGNGAGNRLSKAGWTPAAGITNLTGTEKSVERGYQLRIGEGRFAATAWYPATQVFPAPWAGVDNIKVGATFYERRFGGPASPCVVTEVGATNHDDVSAKCDGSETASRVKRQDMAPFFKVPALPAVQPGQIVYSNKMYWAIVVAKQNERPVIRESGFAAKDKAVDISKIELVR